MFIGLAALLAIGLVLSLLSNDNGGSSTTDRGDLTLYCDALAKMTPTFQELLAGTLTPSEAVSQLDGEEHELEQAALLNDAQSGVISALADAVGRLKVAIDAGGSIHQASQDLDATLRAAPSCA